MPRLQGHQNRRVLNYLFFSFSWYYGKIRRVEAEQLLLQEPHDGAFLIRDSESTAGM